MNIYNDLSDFEEPNKKTYDGPWIHAGEWCFECEERSLDHHCHKYCSECDMISEFFKDECFCHQISVNEYIRQTRCDPYTFFLKNNIKRDISYAYTRGKSRGLYYCRYQRKKEQCHCVFICGYMKVCAINGKTGNPIYKKCKFWSDTLKVKDVCHECIGKIDLK